MYISEYQNIFENKDTHWWYQGMGQITTNLFDKFLPKKRGLTILDAGCGPGAAFGYLKKYGQLTGCDISPEALKFARRSPVKVVKASITKLPFKNNTFDLVTCFDVLYHLWVNDYRLALKEFYRVLKPGGTLVLREPAFASLKSSHDVVDMGQRRFTKKELDNALKRNGFHVLKISFANFFLFPLVLAKRLPEALGIKKPVAKSDVAKLPSLLNCLLAAILKIEAYLLPHLNLPWGSSLVCLSQKKS